MKIRAINILSNDERFDIKWMCNELGVNESSYYSYKKSLNNKQKRKNNEINIVNKIISIFNTHKSRVGARTIKMKMDHWCKINNLSPVNLKRIRRIMKENDLICNIRSVDPYRKMLRATKNHRTYPNLLKREFNVGKPYEKLLTDITYLNYSQDSRAYLSAIKDSITGETPSYKIRKDLSIRLLTDVIDKLPEKCITKNTLIHSDQGVHYTSPKFSRKLKSRKIIQSMSRRGNCWDNAPMESFFGYLKDEINLQKIKFYSELESEINKYMKYYNHQRSQWTKKKLTPVEYRNQLLSI